MACFDSRISQLPNVTKVVNYFRWRNQDAHRNSLNAHCYWCLRRDGKSATQATSLMKGLSVADKNELLFQQGINFNDLPNWQNVESVCIGKNMKKWDITPKQMKMSRHNDDVFGEILIYP